MAAPIAAVAPALANSPGICLYAHAVRGGGWWAAIDEVAALPVPLRGAGLIGIAKGTALPGPHAVIFSV